MRLATFDVENIFDRPSFMNIEVTKGRAIFDDFLRLKDLSQKQEYSQEDKQEMLKIMKYNKGLLTQSESKYTQSESKYILLRVIKGKFVKMVKGGSAEIVANGRNDWIGWFELRSEPVKDSAIENTGRVFREVGADVVCVMEVESRNALNWFNDIVISKDNNNHQKYNHLMLIDGNDDRPIDVGIMTRESFNIESILSHVDDADTKGKIFTRDCAEYKIKTPLGNTLLVLVNHFKSNSYGSVKENIEKRNRQAARTAQIYEDRLNQGFEFIAIVGVLNDQQESDSLRPLLNHNPPLIDIMAHDKFTGDGHPGTFGNGTASQKLDYILMSPQLSSKVLRGSIERRGVWGGKHGTLFPHFAEIKSARDSASDHAALWVDLDL